MAKMGRYCKAYPISRLREFPNWTENTSNLRKEPAESNGKSVEQPRQLTGDDFLYLQEDFTVTDGIFLDENIVFDKVTPDWIDYCKNSLNFAVPAEEAVSS
jgi:hypothetical protein